MMNGTIRALGCLAFMASFLVAGAAAATAGDIIGRATVIDGDSISIGGQEIRLWGIDAPEATQSCRRDGEEWPCGKAASAAIEDLVRDQQVLCEEIDTDRYGRTVARCRVSRIDVGGELVRRGLALAYRRYSGDHYSSAERTARDAARGLWSGAFVPPWDWRTGMRLAETNEPPGSDCTIKGNINRKGGRIYHMPGTRDYDRTRINPADGERWFCTEAEARAAGWRRPGE